MLCFLPDKLESRVLPHAFWKQSEPILCTLLSGRKTCMEAPERPLYLLPRIGILSGMLNLCDCLLLCCVCVCAHVHTWFGVCISVSVGIAVLCDCVGLLCKCTWI